MNEASKQRVVMCNHMLGTYRTDHVGNGWIELDEKESIDDYEKHHAGFEFMPFKFCPKCGGTLAVD